jgi:hypothetical protein
MQCLWTFFFYRPAAPAVKFSGVNGVPYAVEPMDACSPLRTKAIEGSVSPFALVIRGGCQFDDKVRNAQDAGFKAAVVYDNEDNGVLVSSNDPDIIFYHSFSYMLSFISIGDVAL